MSQVYVRCCKTVGQANLTHGKEYKQLGRNILRGQVTVRNDADMVFSYDSSMFGGAYTHGKDVPKEVIKHVKHKWYKEIHAWAEGHKIDCWNKDGSDAWVWAPYPTFSTGSAMRYRIQPVLDVEAIAELIDDIAMYTKAASKHRTVITLHNRFLTTATEKLAATRRRLKTLEAGDKPDD